MPPSFAVIGKKSRKERKNKKPLLPSGFLSAQLRSFDLTGAQATSADVYRLVRAFYHSLNSADVGLPGTIGLAVGVRNVMSESNALTAYTTLCHFDTSHMHSRADDVIP